MTTVTAAIIIRDGKVLIARRNPDLTNGGRWEFPGGKLKAGESPRGCLKRELKEELGIEAEVLDRIGTRTHKGEHRFLKLIFYKTIWITGEMRLRDHTEVQWVRANQLSEYDLTPADRRFAESFEISGD
jgi:8-oxo-dGTP diphosphatase